MESPRSSKWKGPTSLQLTHQIPNPMNIPCAPASSPYLSAVSSHVRLRGKSGSLAGHGWAPGGGHEPLWKGGPFMGSSSDSRGRHPGPAAWRGIITCFGPGQAFDPLDAETRPNHQILMAKVGLGRT